MCDCFWHCSILQLANRSRNNRSAAVGACARRETKGKPLQISPCRVGRLAPLFDGPEQLRHRSVEAVLEPGARELWRPPTLGSIERDALLLKAWPRAHHGPLAPLHVATILFAKAHIGI